MCKRLPDNGIYHSNSPRRCRSVYLAGVVGGSRYNVARARARTYSAYACACAIVQSDCRIARRLLGDWMRLALGSKESLGNRNKTLDKGAGSADTCIGDRIVSDTQHNRMERSMSTREAWAVARQNTLGCYWNGSRCLNLAGVLNELRGSAGMEWTRLYGLCASFVVTGREADWYNRIVGAYQTLRRIGLASGAVEVDGAA